MCVDFVDSLILGVALFWSSSKRRVLRDLIISFMLYDGYVISRLPNCLFGLYAEFLQSAM